jgi:Thioredoxin like C-terminal domain
VRSTLANRRSEAQADLLVVADRSPTHRPIGGRVGSRERGAKIDPTIRPAVHLPAEGHFPPLLGATEWLHSPPLDPAGLRGRVVVIDFCTYTCINWIRTLPFVRAWADGYRDDGLVVIGVHTPEFSFERDHENIRRALEQMRVTWPIAVDSDYAVWNAFANHYWPALYFIDAEGRIRHHRFGEGDEARSEIVIQQLLAEAGADVVVGEGLVPIEAAASETPADWGSLNTGETYLGYRKTENLASPGGMAPNEPKRYETPDHVRRNHWALAGHWTATAEASVLEEPKGRVVFRFDARDVHLVMGPARPGERVPFHVSIDGEPPAAAAGGDVDADGSGELIEPRMYQLIRQPGPITDRLFEIEFLDGGAAIYAFTFG